MDTKTCSKCRRALPPDAFYRAKKWNDGLHPWCKECFLTGQKERYERRMQESPPHHRWHREAVIHDYFSHIDNALQAYLLGFLAADGNILSSVPRITIELAMKDNQLLTMIRDELAPKHNIRERERKSGASRFGVGVSGTLAFTSAVMVKDLARYGIVPAKTLTLRWPDALPTQLAHAYLLGYFDGDGHISYTVVKGRRYPIWGVTSGALAFLTDVVDVVRKQTGIVIGGPYYKGGNSYSIRITGAQALTLDVWLHQSRLGLARKRLTTQ